MRRTASLSGPAPEFDAFLFALVGEDSTGLPLSVLSVLARMNLDPWQEAAELANQPADAATRRLAGLLDAVPDESLRNGDRKAIATRLIALLLQRSSFTAKPLLQPSTLADKLRARPRTYAILIAIGLFLLLLSQLEP